MAATDTRHLFALTADLSILEAKANTKQYDGKYDKFWLEARHKIAQVQFVIHDSFADATSFSI